MEEIKILSTIRFIMGPADLEPKDQVRLIRELFKEKIC